MILTTAPPGASQADAVSTDIDRDLEEAGAHDMTAKFGARLVKKERCDYLRPTVRSPHALGQFAPQLVQRGRLGQWLAHHHCPATID